MKEWPAHMNLKEIRGFQGLTGYYHRFGGNYDALAHTLTQLTNKETFQWGEDAQYAFGSLKQAMMTLLVLTLPDLSKPFEIETDTSGSSLGAVLMQNQQAITYYSHSLLERARAKSVYE